MKALPGIEYDGPERLPWPGTLSRKMAGKLWKGLEPFFNMRPPGNDVELLRAGSDLTDIYHVYQKRRHELQQLVEGRWRFEGKAIPAAPVLLVGSRRWGVSWALRGIDLLRVSAGELDVQCRFLLGLLALPEVRPLLKQCSICRTFWLNEFARRQKKSGSTRRDYCPECREPGYREVTARRQREHRQRKTRPPQPPVRLVLKHCTECDTFLRTEERPKEGDYYCPSCRERARSKGKRRRPNDPGRRSRA